jgi:hypothetical protein
MKIYLAAPYSAPTEAEREARFIQANKAAAFLMQKGHIVFSPISHSHPIAHHIGNHLSHDFWLKQDFSFMDWADELWILCADGWEQSKGIALEIERWCDLTVGRLGAIRHINPSDVGL